jgi:hypothetical protein
MSDDDQISATITTGNYVSGSVSSTAQSLTANVDSEGILTVDKFQVSPEGLQLGNLVNVDNTNLPDESILYYDQSNSIWKSSSQTLDTILTEQRPKVTEFDFQFSPFYVSTETLSTGASSVTSNTIGKELDTMSNDFTEQGVMTIPGTDTTTELDATQGTRRKKLTYKFTFAFLAYGKVTSPSTAFQDVDTRVKYQLVGTPVSKFTVQSITGADGQRYTFKISEASQQSQPIGIKDISVNGRVALGNVGNVASQFLPILGYRYYDGFAYISVYDPSQTISSGDTIYYSETGFTGTNSNDTNASAYASEDKFLREYMYVDYNTLPSEAPTGGAPAEPQGIAQQSNYFTIEGVIDMPASSEDRKVYFETRKYYQNSGSLAVVPAAYSGVGTDVAGEAKIRLVSINGRVESY